MLDHLEESRVLLDCVDCGRTMFQCDCCTKGYLKISHNYYKRIPSSSSLGKGRCHDCGVKAGYVHHYGCDMERCPKCGDQLISCDCNHDKINTTACNVQIVE